MSTSRQKDLVVLVADVQQEKTLKTLLQERQHSLGIRTITFDIHVHPLRDPAVFKEGDSFLVPFAASYDYALVVLDAAWDGAPAGGPSHLQTDLRRRMAARGWDENRCQVIVIEPELEAWVWTQSSVVPTVLRTTWPDIRALAAQLRCWDQDNPKPNRPKELLEVLLRQQRRARSSALFIELARQVTLDGCQDTAFVLLRKTLREWFGTAPLWMK